MFYFSKIDFLLLFISGLVLKFHSDKYFLFDFMIIMVLIYFKVFLWLIRGYISLKSKNYYIKIYSKLYLYDLTLVFESLFKKDSKKDSCSCYVFPVFVIIIGSILRGDGNELWKTKKGFCPQQNHSQKPLFATAIII